MKAKYRGMFYFINFLAILFFLPGIDAKAEINDSYLNFDNITINDGLSQGTVDDIFQDSEGYVWFATNDGLNQYNGETFRVYKGDTKDNNSIWPGVVISVNEDIYGGIWVGTSGGLAVIDKNTSTVKRFYVDINDSKKLSHHNIWEVFRDSNDNMWVATEYGLNKYDYKTGDFEKYLSDSYKTNDRIGINDVEEDSKGNIIVSTTAGFRMVDKKNYTFKAYNDDENSLLLESKIADLYKEKESGDIFISTKTGELYKYDVSKRVLSLEISISEHYDDKNIYIKSMTEDVKGNMWLGTTKGLYKYYREEKRFIKYVNKAYDLKTLVNDNISDIEIDKSGLMWIGTSNGVSKVNLEQKFINYQQKYGEENTLGGKSATGIFEDESGNLWIGTTTGGVSKLDRESNVYEYYTANDEKGYNLSSDFVWQVTGDDKGNIWVATRNGLNKIDIETGKVKTYFNNPNDIYSLVHNDVREIYIDNKGLIWIGTRDGICVLNPETDKFMNLNHVLLENNIDELFVRRIFQDSKGVYWLSVGWNTGVVELNPITNDVILHANNSSNDLSLSDNVVMSVNEDLNGDIWIATANGLNRFNKETKTVEIFKEADGLVNSYVYGILVDKEGNIWASTNGGISKFDIKQETFENYTYTDGLQSNEFNVISDFQSESGEIFFGGVDGVTSFFPENINREKIELLPINISSFNVYNNDDIKYKKNIILSHDENNFAIDFLLPYYKDAKSIKYEYMLDGFDENWISAGVNKHATYTNISPGEYKFRVRARYKGNILSKEKNFNIKIKDPWYFSNIAIMIYLVIIICIVILIINYFKILDGLVKQRTIELNAEIKANEKMYEEKEELYKDLIKVEKFRNTYLVNLSHELRTPLNVILSSQQLVTSLNKTTEGVQKDKLDNYMEIIKSNSRNLLEVINDLIDTSKIRSGAYNVSFEKQDIVFIVEEIALSMKTFVESEGLEFIIDPEIEEKEIWCSKKEIERCVSNLISNAVKFTEHGGVFVGIRDIGNFVEIIVKDSGKGISREHQSIIFDRFTQIEDGVSSRHFSSGIGLNLVKDLVNLHGGTISVKSELGWGSEFIIRLPIKKEGE